MLRRVIAVVAALVLASGAAAARPGKAVLIFSHTTGYRHASIEPGRAALMRDLSARGYAVTASEDPELFSDTGLAPFDAVVLLSTTTDPKDFASEWLNGPRGAAFQRWFRAKGAVVGIHAAADSHYHWPWYGAMLGSQFVMHPPGTPSGTLRAQGGWGLPAERVLAEEWYRLGTLAEDDQPIASVDGAFSEGGAAWPVSYTHRFEGRRVFYTSLGHMPERYGEATFLAHVATGLAWALGSD